MNDIVRAQRPVRLPVVLSREKVASLRSHLSGPVWLMASLMDGAGLRLLEYPELRVKDINFDRGERVVRDGKGGKDRVTMLPGAMKGPLVAHLTRVKAQHEADEAAWRCRARFERSTRTRRVSGRGSGCFPRLASTWIRRPASDGGIICTKLCCNVR